MKKIDQLLQSQKTIYNFKKKIEAFFESQNFTFIQPPLLSSLPIPEASISLFSTQYKRFNIEEKLYLLPSPELYLKTLISHGAKNIFTITPAFRNGEALEGSHNIEFTMLEYYLDNANYIHNMEFTKRFLSSIFDRKIEFTTLTLEEAFLKWANFSLEEAIKTNQLREMALAAGFKIESSWSSEEIFNYIMVDKIEPSLPENIFCFLTNYPAFVATTSKKLEGTPFTQRWELYYNKIEIANCYTEIDSYPDIKAYYKEELKLINGTSELSPKQEAYIKQFENFPLCSGPALGIERLLMAYLQTHNINSILLFPNKTPFLT